VPVDCTIVGLKEYGKLKRAEIENTFLRSGRDNFLKFIDKCHSGDIQYIRKMAHLYLGDKDLRK
jgi:hypothetical protein